MNYKSFLKDFLQIGFVALVLSVMVLSTYVYADRYEWSTNTGNAEWSSVTISDSGIGYASNNNVLYKNTSPTSNFSGQYTFNEKIKSIATDSSGTYVIVSTNNPGGSSGDGYVYYSNNGGGTFTQMSYPGQEWQGVAISEGGQYMYAVNDNGTFRYTDNYGSSWYDVSGISGATLVKVSNMGDKVYFGGTGSQFLYLMEDYSGVINQTLNMGYPIKDFDVSADGSKVAIVLEGTTIPAMYNYGIGASTVSLPDTGSFLWKAAVISGDGTVIGFLRAFQNDSSAGDGALYVSIDGGTTFHSEYKFRTDVGGYNWTDLSISSDSYNILLSSSSGYVHAGSYDTSAPTIQGYVQTTANGVYGVGAQIDTYVLLNEPDFSGSAPMVLTFETGTVDRTCTVAFANESATSSVCSFVVQSGNSTADLSTNQITGTVTNRNGFSRSDFSSWVTLFSAQKDIVIDGVAPTVSLTAPLTGSFASGTLTINASASDTGSNIAGVQFAYGSGVSITNIGSEDSSSPYSVTLNTSLIPDGTYTLYAVARDSASPSNRATSTVSITVDNTAPVAPGTPDLISAADTGYLSNDNVSASTTPTFTVSCVSGNTVRLRNGLTTLGTAVCSSSSATITSSSLSAGTYSLTAIQTDQAGNTSSASSGLSITIDTTNPTVSITSPVNGSTATGTITLIASASDNNSVYGVQFRNVTAGSDIGSQDTSAPYSITYNTTLVSDGSTVFRVTVTDTAGNTAQATTTLTILNTAPSAPGTPALDSSSDTGQSSSDGITTDTTPTVTASCQTGNRVDFYRGGSTFVASTTCASSSASVTSSVLSAGTYSITATQINTSIGIPSATSSALSITIDTTNPTVSITSPADTSTASGTISIEATASDNNSVYGVQFAYGSGATITNIGSEDTTSAYSVSLDTTTLTDGAYTLYAVTRDTAGNLATSTIGVTVDNSVPSSTPSATSTSTTTQTVSTGSVSAGGIAPLSQTPQAILRGIQQSGADIVSNATSVTRDIARTIVTSSGVPSSFLFTRNAGTRTVSSEVQNLQRVLNTLGYTVSPSGNGSVGNETTVFGLRTRAALIRFQRAFAIPATGFFGPLTRSAMNSILNALSR